MGVGAWAVSVGAHGVLLATALVLTRDALPTPPPQPATVQMAFVAPPAAATTAPAAAEPVPPPEPPPPPPPEPLPVPEAAPAVAPPPEVPKPPQRPAPVRAGPAPPRTPHPAPKPQTAPKPPSAPEAQTPGPAAPASPPHADEAHTAAIDGGWMRQVGAWLAAHKTYPDEARQRGEEGRLAVRFTMDRSGRVTDVEVVRGSGSPALDRAAVAMLQDAALPPLPKAMPQATVTVTVQIRYALTP
jgi:protein TonB